MNSQVWPFVISRSRSIDYRTLVAPDFILEAKSVHVISDNAGGEREHVLLSTHVPRSPVGPLSLFYRIVPAQHNEEYVLDAFGRQVNIIEGVVMKGIIKDGSVTLQTLEDIHSQYYSTLTTFWNEDNVIQIVPAHAMFETGSKNVPDIPTSMPPVFSMGQIKRYGYIALLIILAGSLYFSNKQKRQLAIENENLRLFLEESGLEIPSDDLLHHMPEIQDSVEVSN